MNKCLVAFSERYMSKAENDKLEDRSKIELGYSDIVNKLGAVQVSRSQMLAGHSLLRTHVAESVSAVQNQSGHQEI